jgi:hypothetical protein
MPRVRSRVFWGSGIDHQLELDRLLHRQIAHHEQYAANLRQQRQQGRSAGDPPFRTPLFASRVHGRDRVDVAFGDADVAFAVTFVAVKAAPRYPQHLTILAELSGNRVTAISFAEARLREDLGPNTDASTLVKLEGEATEVASRLLDQLRGVMGLVAVLALADAAASVLGSKPGTDRREARLVFDRMLARRLKGYE